MIRKKPEAIGGIIAQVLRDNNLEQTLLEKRAVDAWEKVIGQSLARYTDTPQIKNGVLFVHVKSAPLKQEFFLGRKEIVRRLNNAIGATIVKDIRLL